MSLLVNAPIILAAAYLWIGFVGAISFMEAWIKFRAPGVNLQIGLGIGRLVFNALNKVEWIFAIAIIAGIFLSEKSFKDSEAFLFYVPLIILLTQSFWLLPALDQRIEMRTRDVDMPSSPLHLYYVIAEIIKVMFLFVYSLQQFKA